MPGKKPNRVSPRKPLIALVTLLSASLIAVTILWKEAILPARIIPITLVLILANLVAILLITKREEPVAAENLVKGIEELKKAVEDLKGELKAKEGLLSSLQESTIRVSKDLKIEGINGPTENLTGYSKKELIGMPIEKVYKDPLEIKLILENIREPTTIDEIEIKKKDGSTLICKQLITPLEDGGFIVSSLNITGQLSILRNLERRNEELKRANEEKESLCRRIVNEERFRILGVMASGTAHTFNNILSIILGSTELMEAKGVPEEFKKGLERIKKASLEGAKVVVRLQELAMKDYEEKMENVDLSPHIKATVEGLKPLFIQKEKEKEIKIRVESEVEPTLPVKGNINELKEAFMSVVSSSLDIMGGEGSILIRAFRSGDDISIVFSLNGVTLEENERDKLFNPFVDIEGRRRFSFGMNVAKWIIERHGGKITIDPVEDGKTALRISLPCSQASVKGVQKENMEPPPEGHIEEGIRALVVDDEEDIAEILADQIANLGGKAEVAYNGEEALERFKKAKESGRPFNIVLADISMPKMDGWELSEKLNKEFSFGNVVLVTGWGVEVPASKVKKYGIKRVVSKPFTIEDIKSVLSEIGKEPKKA